MPNQFGADVWQMVRQAIARERYDLLYIMTAADDGGESYEMKCKICGELGNILASKFIHADGCPVGKLER